MGIPLAYDRSNSRGKKRIMSKTQQSRLVPSAFYPVVIVGAGPAGSALAALLARRGRKVALLERDAFPRDKLCGEFLSGESRRLLREIGCLPQILALNPPEIRQMQFTAPGGARLDVPLPSPALGVSRRELDTILFRHAGACGAETFERSEVESILPGKDAVELTVSQHSGRGGVVRHRIRAALVVGAYGRHSRLDRDLGRLARERRKFVGFKRHHTAADARALLELAGCGEVHLFSGGYCGVAEVEKGIVNVCLLIRAERLKRLAPSGEWEELAEALAAGNSSLARRLRSLLPVPDEPALAVAPVPFGIRKRAAGRVLFSGDSAGMIAPLCGDGQAMALESAELLAQLIGSVAEDALGREAERVGNEWADRWEGHFRRRLRLGRWLQKAALSPYLAGATLHLLRAIPGSAPILARATRGA